VIDDLLGWGMTQTDIQAATGISQPWLSQLRSTRANANVGYAVGAALLALHSRRKRLASARARQQSKG
jgi:hypothetical protein